MSASNTPSSSSTLRPRVSRLISGLSDAGDDPVRSSSRGPSPIPSPAPSRRASPLPAAHPQRNAWGASWGRRAQLGGGQGSPASAGGSLTEFWGSSWNSLQGLASEFLGTESGGDSVDKQRGKLKGKLYPANSPGVTTEPSQWGPTPQISSVSSSSVGTGTRKEREAAVRAQKRKDMLVRDELGHADALGKVKRRLSDHNESVSAPPGEFDNRDALVYLHHVGKTDTLAGITIKYNCPAVVIRKTNRMWPNDAVQVRRTIFLPVDACGVKGKPVSGPEAMDLLTSTTESEVEALSAGQAEEVLSTKPLVPNGQGAHHARTISSSTVPSRRPSLSVHDATTEHPWQHNSWVLLPGSTQPTELARLSRRALGYFPPARRKSANFSDLDTPATSLDLNRRPGPAINPDRPEGGNSPQRPRRSRSSSTATTGYFPSYLSGPGGVGTMARNVHSPGPAQDGLNKRFAKMLPDVAPPKNQTILYQPELPLDTNAATAPPLGSQTPSYPLGATNLSVNLENVGGAIESWVRKMAKTVTPAERGGTATTPNRRPIGDLIEMTDEFEIGGDDDMDEGERDGYLGSRPNAGVSLLGTSFATPRGRSKGKAD